MKKILSKKYLTTLISSFTVGTGIILACAGDWGPDYGTSNFTPEAFVDSAYKPFFYSQWNFYYEIGYDMQHDTRFNEANINDWSSALGNSIPHTELEYLLQTATSPAVDSVSRFLTGKGKTMPLPMQSFQLFKKNDKKITAFITYLSLAKRCEAFAANNFAYAWDYESKKDKPAINTSPLNKELLQEFTKTTDAFIKERYWFQLERSYFFNEPPQSAIAFFENNEKAFPKNDMYYRSMAYAAGAYHKLKNYPKANYYYSKVYDGCAALKTVAHYSFHPQEETDWKATLALCTSDEEKVTLWQMLGIFYGDEKRAIQEIYALNPRSEKLNLLLTRAINIREQSFSGWQDGRLDVPLQSQKDSSGNQLLTLVTRIAQAGNTHQPYMWHMAAGYLQMFHGNTQKAAASYAAAEKKLPGEERVKWQLRLLKLINTIASVPNVNSKLENAVVKDLEWLYGIQITDDYFRRATAFDWIKRTMANRYIKQKEFVKAVCFSNYKAFYTSDSNIEAMKSFLNKPNQTSYEALCAKLYIMKTGDLLEYQAIRATYDENLEDAIAKLEATPESAPLPGNPFNGRLQDCHDCDHEAAQKIKYTKLSLLKKMKEMKDKIKAGTEVYTNAMLLANAFYNCTHYGNARAFYECEVIGRYHYSPDAIDSAFRGFLTDMKLATKYYTLALTAAKTDEQKAKCHFMLAKCERNQWYNETVFNNEYVDHGQQPDFLPWNGFKALQQYQNTQFYKEAIKECGYFRTYTKK